VLNPSKCVWLCFNWHIGTNGHPKIIPPPASTALSLTIHGHPLEKIPLLNPKAAHRYLGVYLTTDGNCNTEITLFSNAICNTFNWCKHVRSRTGTLLWSIGNATYRFLLLLCHQHDYTSYKAQPPPSSSPSWAIHAHFYELLPTCHRTKVAWASCISAMNKAYKNVCNSSSTYVPTPELGLYWIVLQHYQLLSGLPTLILENTRSIPWSNAPWIDTVRQFLHAINGQILVSTMVTHCSATEWLFYHGRHTSAQLANNTCFLDL